MTVYEQPITTVDTFYVKFFIYLISFILRWFVKNLVNQMKKMRIMTKSVFYFVYFQNIMHFMLFNTFITNGVFLTSRTLLHMRWFAPGGVFYYFDKTMCLIIFFVYIWDLYELLVTSIDHTQTINDCSPSVLLAINKAKIVLAEKGSNYFKGSR